MTGDAFDVVRARCDTPACEKVLHFNNAGAALMPRQVLEAVAEHLRLEGDMGGYEAADLRSDVIERVYNSVASLIGCSRDEVAIVENATRGWDMAFYAVGFKPGDRILTSVAEYGSNFIAFLQVARRTGAVIDVIPNEESGQLSVEALRDMIDDRVRLIAITHVPTNGGLVNPAGEVGKLARAAGVLYLLDACQSVGQMPVDVNQIGCDMLSATARKFLRGPRGIGFLYVRRSILDQLEPPFLDLHAATWTARDRYVMRQDARRFENWEKNYAGSIGMGVAADYALSWGLESIQARVQDLGGALRDRLRSVPNVKVCDLGIHQCGIVTFTIEGRKPEDTRRLLGQQQMNVSVSSIESTRLDMEGRGIERMVRASVHYYNTEEEIGRFCGAIEGITGAQGCTG